jgi:RecA-family ATPase
MSTAPDNLGRIGPDWNGWRVPLIGGTFDTRIKTGEDYEATTLAAIFTMEPANKPKLEGPAFVPSTHCDFDAREHAAQRTKGEFVALTGDIDEGNHPLSKVEDLVRGFARDAAWLIYSSPHARPGDMRWRIVIPLSRALSFDHWHDAQNALFDFMEESGVEMDRALARAAQLVFLPNVPDTHEKSGTALRGDDGAPLYFERATSGTTAPGLVLNAGPIATYVATIRRKREADERERERIRKEAQERRASSPPRDGASIMDDFNQATSIETLLELYGYERSPRNGDDWRSPNQTGETYATRVMGDFWISLSGSDVGVRLGQTCKAGCFGDAYDLFVHYEHGGDHKAAQRVLYAERRAGMPIAPNEPPPPVDPEDPGPEPLEMDEDAEPVYAEVEEAEPTALLDLFHPADWHGTSPPERIWRWDRFIPDQQATLLTGAGAAGKSLATQQMSTCIAMGLPFLGVETRSARALYITCEDDLDELHRRQEAICAALRIPLEQTRGRLFLLSLQGQIGNELALFTPEGAMTIAPRYFGIERTCLELGIGHVTLDNTAHTFAGNENDRHQVAAFVNLNNRLARTINGSVVMVGHPNKAGDSYSGSTAWENQVRSRLYLEVPKNGDEGPVDPDMRVLRNEKANYSQRGSEVTFYWLKGAFVTEAEMPLGNDRDLRETARAGYENELFLRLLDTLSAQKRHVSHAPNLGHYAPRVMAGMPEAKGLSKAALARAMERLFATNQIVASQPLWKGTDRHPVLGLARKEA